MVGCRLVRKKLEDDLLEDFVGVVYIKGLSIASTFWWGWARHRYALDGVQIYFCAERIYIPFEWTLMDSELYIHA